MRKLFKSTNSKIVLSLALLGEILFLGSSAFAEGVSPRAQVLSVKGKAFITRNNMTSTLKAGSHIYDFDTIRTETGSSLSFSDFYEHRYHISGAAHLKVFNRMVELKAGYLWLVTGGKPHGYQVQTANGVLSYEQGEGVISFDPYVGKTQFLNVKGEFQFGNIVQQDIKTSVREGHFSYIDNSDEDSSGSGGVPRRPTPIGYKSFQKIMGIFKGVEESKKVKAASISGVIPAVSSQKPVSAPRENASVSKAYAQAGMKFKGNSQSRTIASTPKSGVGKIHYIEDKSPKQSDMKSSINSYLKSKMNKMKKDVDNKPWRPKYTKKSNVKLRVFGKKPAKRVPTSKPVLRVKKVKSVKVKNHVKESVTRMPASVPHINSKGFTPKKKEDPFEKSLMDNYKNQMRHDKETNSLINDLKSYRQDYQISY
ncbi:MAG: hypothetical protein ACPGJV_00080 [Bacteriovoracaceae bacterium]